MGSLLYAVAWATNGGGLANQICGWLRMDNVSFDDPLLTPGSFSGDILIKSRDVGNRVQQITLPDQTAIYAIWVNSTNNNRTVLWGGPIDGRSWNPVTQVLTIKASQWESWFNTREVTPNPGTNALQDALFSFTNVDQFDIMRNLITTALSEVGCPIMPYDSTSVESGVLRTIAWQSSSFKSYGDAIKELSQQSGGFLWSVVPKLGYSSSGLQAVIPTITFYFPERQPLMSVYPMRLSSRILPSGARDGNIITYDWPEDVTNRVSRVWEQGSGTGADQVFRNAVSSDYIAGTKLYREMSDSNTGITDTTLLDQHGRDKVHALSQGVLVSTIALDDEHPKLDSYNVGDRTQLVLSDNWLAVTLPAARIINRSIKAPDAQHVWPTLTVDVTDAFGPLVEV